MSRTKQLLIAAGAVAGTVTGLVLSALYSAAPAIAAMHPLTYFHS